MAFRFGPGPLLDSFPGAQAAYSLRKLNSSYTGSCLTVRRSSDNATTNIGFYRYTIDTDAILRFVGSGNGFVTTWFDQSGNGVNISQGATSLQFNIVTSGSLHYEGNDVVLNAATNRSFTRGTSTVSLNSWTVYTKSRISLTAGSYIGGNFGVMIFSSAGGYAFRNSTDSLYKIVGPYTTAYTKLQMKRTGDTGALQGYSNGVSTGTNSTTLPLLLTTGTTIFGSFASIGYQGTVREMLIYPVTHDNLTVLQINNMM
jgi:hypothetical protein